MTYLYYVFKLDGINVSEVLFLFHFISSFKKKHLSKPLVKKSCEIKEKIFILLYIFTISVTDQYNIFYIFFYHICDCDQHITYFTFFFIISVTVINISYFTFCFITSVTDQENQVLLNIICDSKKKT